VRRVFVDTSAFFAHLVAEDRHDPQACALFEKAARESWALITTNAVVSETYTLIRNDFAVAPEILVKRHSISETEPLHRDEAEASQNE
jgi:predicted nucleic acid-binding protein